MSAENTLVPENTPAPRPNNNPIRGADGRAEGADSPQVPSRSQEGHPKVDRRAVMAERKAEYLAKLRGDLNVPAPAPVPQPVEQPEARNVAPVAPVTPDYIQKVLDERRAADAALAQVQAEKAEAARVKAEAEAAAQKLKLATKDPLEFLAQTGFTEDDWKEMLANGGELTPERKFKREIEKQQKEMAAQLEAMKGELAKKDAEARAAAETATIAAGLKDYPAVSRLGGAPAIRERMAQMQKQMGQAVSWDQAATLMEAEFISGLKATLQDPAIAAKLGMTNKSSANKPQSEQAAPKTPTTLGRQTAPTTGAQSKPNPKDWAAKKAAYIAMLKAQQR